MKREKIQIRKATKQDKRLILSLDKEASNEIIWWEVQKKSTLNKDLFYIIEINKKIGGYLRASKKKEFIGLEDLFIKKSFRNKGYAQKLVLYFIRDISKTKHKKIKLLCPERLRKFNETLGFKVTSLNMEKNLK